MAGSNQLDAVWVDAFGHGIKGDFTHVEPCKAVAGLDAESAGRQVGGMSHTIYQITAHAVAWWEWGHAAMKGVRYEAPADAYHANFFPAQAVPTAEQWEGLMRRVAELSGEFSKLLPDVDPRQLHPEAKQLDYLAGFTESRVMLFVVQHLAYHLGQIVVMRKTMGKWEEGT